MGIPRSTAEIREAFQAFFAEKGCVRYASASLVPESDTTLFTVAGMSQFKDMFLGRGTHPFTRATTSQKCIRTNDILNVGRTARHHTFFEMLGNFSFNDYFKKEAIHWAWEFLTQRLQLDPTRLSISVHRIDGEAYRIWREEIGIPAERIFKLGDADNFWPANAPSEGPEGPGGCCSEIFWDHRTNDDPADNLTSSTGRFVEIWNLVFPEFNVRKPNPDGTPNLENLGRSNIDTGSGLERVAAVMQGVYNNFDIDLFQTIIRAVVAVSGVPYVKDAKGGPEADRNVLTRRVSDHVRAVSFCIADGALPGNNDRGYIVRRLIRRATLDITRLGVEQARLHEIVPAVVEAMGETYPELGRRRELIVETLKAEEQMFRRTLGKGMDLFERALARNKASGVFSGDDAFELVTTNGFPKEIIEELAGAENLKIDEQRFAERWDEFVKISQGDRKVEVFTSTALQQAKPRLGATPFIGYSELETLTALTLLEVDGQEVAQAPLGAKVRFALERTPFYAESGGQVGDIGRVRGGGIGSEPFEIRVVDTQKDDKLVIHFGEVTRGTAKPGQVKAEVDEDSRKATTRHHTSTHLLHSALGHVLGHHVEQQGSKVEPASLRFDYNNPTPPTREQLAEVERWVNERVAGRYPVAANELPIEEAKKLGAKAQFGEKYGQHVRVISIAGGEVSREFCGGCHVVNTADIGTFRIVKDEATAAGIRRIIAVAGDAAEQLVNEQQSVARACATIVGGAGAADAMEVEELARSFKVPVREVPGRLELLVREVTDLATRLMTTMTGANGSLTERVDQLQVELKRLRRLAEERKSQAAAGSIDRVLAAASPVGGAELIAATVEGADAKSLRSLLDLVRQRKPECVAVLGAVDGGKALLAVSVGPALIKRGLSAGDLVGKLAKLVGGGGGGKPDVAQAGGKDGAQLPAALAAVPRLVEDALAAKA
ncbi:MAG: alanine--tRNA ligase [Planctomycetes bacterium]|nr:alanine--tRNA ligase [Planctomycetota bacterium]